VDNKELQKLTRKAERKARAHVLGFSESPFAAVAWRKTLPKEVQPAIEEAIVRIYHTM